MMDMEWEIVENFGSILLMEWVEKANSLIPNGGVCRNAGFYLEDGTIKTLALLRSAFETILSAVPERSRKEFIVWCADNTQVRIKGELLNLKTLGFFDGFIHGERMNNKTRDCECESEKMKSGILEGNNEK